jgi:CheY-like chemotaxis protein
MALTEIHRPGTTRILVVDDDPIIREFCTKILNQAGYRTLAASGSSDAMWLMTSSSDPFNSRCLSPDLTNVTAEPDPECLSTGKRRQDGLPHAGDCAGVACSLYLQLFIRTPARTGYQPGNCAVFAQALGCRDIVALGESDLGSASPPPQCASPCHVESR